MLKIHWHTTARGFPLGDFQDHYGERCSIQESSLATEFAIWLGRDEERMHLTQAEVAVLLPVLARFVETGELGEANG